MVEGLGIQRKSNQNTIEKIKPIETNNSKIFYTGKSLSDVIIFASTNPQYDDILFIELQVQYVKIPSSELGGEHVVYRN